MPEAVKTAAHTTAQSALKCSRCASPATLRLRKTVPSCTSCALKGFETRAKTTLELARGAALWDKALKKDGPETSSAGAVCLALSGGPSSRALLNVATRSLNLPALQSSMPGSAQTSSSAKRSRPVEVTRLDVVYIDDSAVIPNASDQTDAVRAIVEEQGGAQAGLNFVPLKLEDIFLMETDAKDSSAVDCIVGLAEHRRLASHTTRDNSKTSKQLLVDLYQTLSSPNLPRTAQSSARTRLEEIHYVLVQQLLRRTARRLDCRALLLGENSSRGSIRLMESLAKGGAHKWPIAGATSVWIDDLCILRPLKDALSKEVAFYNRAAGLNHIVNADLTVSAVLSGTAGGGAAEKASIGRLTENFIYSLEKGVPSTVNTVARTGAKLQLKGGESAVGSWADSLHEEEDGPLDMVGRSGVGQKGDALMYKVIHQVPRWSAYGPNKTTSALPTLSSDRLPLPCPLCGLPAQPGASKWKGKLSIRSAKGQDGHFVSSAESAERLGEQGSDWISLGEMLCYSCLLVLDIASGDEAPSSATTERAHRKIALPPYVLESARLHLDSRQDRASPLGQPSQEQESNGSQSAITVNATDDVDVTAAARSFSADLHLHEAQEGHQGQDESPNPMPRHHVTRKMGQDEMKGKVGEFLL